jgi:glutaconate CoA-transferase subunit B
VIPLPEVFAWYLQAGRIDVGFLGAAQIDRYGNLNSTVIGPYERPTTRLPGAGGATEIAAHARATFVMLKASPRSFVERLDFCTSAGFPAGHGARRASGARGGGPRAVITDFGILVPEPGSGELTLDALFPGATLDEARSQVGWPLAVGRQLREIDPPRDGELATLRALQSRTQAAHSAEPSRG